MNSSHCGSCSMTFSFFKKKNRCSVCNLIFCSPCFKKGQNLPHRNIRQCLKCHAFSSEPLVRSELMMLSIKELKAFLQQHDVSSTGCAEKGDLVDTIIDHHHPTPNAPSSSSSTQSHHSTSSASHVATSSSASSQPHHPNAVFPEHFFGLMHEQTGLFNDDPENRDQAESAVIGNILRALNPRNLLVNCSSSSSPQEHSTMHVDYTTPTHQEYTGPSRVWSTQRDFSNYSPPPASQNTTKPVHVEDFKDSGEIAKLSVKELKALLKDNFVDYKGCFEKDELVQKAVMLWESKQLQKNVSNIDEMTGESDLCKICMDGLVNCVLLDCGHLVTCVECGKKLKECPMCRQNIVRIVRVFKS